MKKIIILLFVFCLTGCSFVGKVQEPDLSVSMNEQLQVKENEENETHLSEKIVQPEPSDDDFVMVKTYIPDVFVDLHYSTENNFTNQKIYDFSDAWLRYGTVKKLISVQEELKQSGIYLKVWDGFRPPSAQFKLWEICPNPTYVANPNNGFSSHSRGNTVDITLVYEDGTELVMPTEFDDFSQLADRNYSDCTKEATKNALLLENLMQKHGFTPYSGEWWHFSDTQSYAVDEVFEPIESAVGCAECNEYVEMQSKPGVSSEVITKIEKGEQFKMVAEYGEYMLIEYKGTFGYILSKYIQPV